MRSGLLIVGILLLAVAVLFGITIVFLPVAALLGILAAILFILARRPEAPSVVVPVLMPTYPQQWHHPTSAMPPPPAPLLPVVVPSTPPKSPYGALSTPIPYEYELRCRGCGRAVPSGTRQCPACGTPV